MKGWLLGFVAVLFVMAVTAVVAARSDAPFWIALECEYPAIQLLRELVHNEEGLFGDLGRSEPGGIALGEKREVTFMPLRCGMYRLRVAWPRGLDIEMQGRNAQGSVQCHGPQHRIKSSFDRGRLGNFFYRDAVGYGLGWLYIDGADALGHDLRCEVVFESAEPLLRERLERNDTFLTVNLASSK
jgi:hypothetical protein